VGIASGEEWTEFRGPGQQGVSRAEAVPLEWGADANVAWRRQLAGSGWSSPVVGRGKIFLTAAVPLGEQQVNIVGESKKADTPFSLRTLCLDPDAGTILWDVEIAQVPAGASIHPKNSHASATPVLSGDRLFVHFGTHGTAALDLAGNLLWKTAIAYKPVHGCGGSPVLTDDSLVFNCDGGDAAFVVALDAATGAERWRTPRPQAKSQTFSFCTPLMIEVDGQPQIVSPGSHAVCGYDSVTGTELWRVCYPNKWSIVPRPVFAGGLVFVCTGYEGPAELLAIRPDGRGDVTATHVAWREDRFVPHNPSPIVHGDALYLISDAGIASCRDLATGELVWKERLSGNHSASPILVGDRIYFLSEEGTCTVVRASRTFEKLATNEMGERTLASLVPVDGGLLLRTEAAICRIGSDSLQAGR